MQSVTGALSINSSNGDLSVADPALFDFETHQQIATIRISAGNTTQEVNVTITINDVNEVDVSTLTLWEGVPVTFSKPNEGDPPMLPTKTVLPTTYGLPEEIRACCTILSQNLQQTMHLAAGTEWAQGTFADIQTLEFTNFRAACPGAKPRM